MSLNKRIDLHIHTTVSDGALAPKEIIDEAYKNGVSVIAIADHDTIEAYTDELFEYAKSKNIKLIRAVEMSTKAKKAGVHVLGYNFDLNNEEFRERLNKIRNARHDYLHNVAKKLEEIGYYINVEELDKIDAVTKAHIALDATTNPQNKEKLLEEFGHIPNKGEFIETIMNENCPAYVHEDNLTDAEIEEIINAMKPDGLEANYLYVDRNDNKFDETEKWNKFAKEHNLFVTAGSDFHNKDGIRPEIGFVNTEFILSEQEINEILTNLEK